MSSARDDHPVSSEAMDALHEELSIPADLEARMLAAADEAAAPVKKRRRFPGGWIALAAALAATGIYAGWSRLSSNDEKQVATAEPPEGVEVMQLGARVRAIDWSDARGWNDGLAALDDLRARLLALSDRRATERVAPIYVDALRRAFLDRCRASLETFVTGVKGDWSEQERTGLRAYLLLGDAERLHRYGARQKSDLTTICSAAIAAETKRSIDEHLIERQIAAFSFLVETKVTAGLTPDAAIVARARNAFFSADGSVRRAGIIGRRATGDNALGLRDLVHETDPGAALIKAKKDIRVPTEYEGHERRAVLLAFEDAEWVIGEGSTAALRHDYEAAAHDSWVAFIRDLEVVHGSPKDTVKSLRALSSSGSALGLLLQEIADNVGPAAPGDTGVAELQPFVAFVRGDHSPLSRYLAVLGETAAKIEASPADRKKLLDAAATETRALLAPLDERSRELLSPILSAPLE